MADLAKNLVVLCSRITSVSALCRQLSINRQQFARYMRGDSKPSQFNIRKITNYFGLPMYALSLPHDQFLKLYETGGGSSSKLHSSIVCQSLDAPDESADLIQGFAGYYWVYLQSPSEPSQLLRSLVHLYVDGGRLLSTWEGSFTRADDGSVQKTRYEGLGRILDGYLFIVDIETTARDRIFETILRIPNRRRTDILTGLTLGMTTGWHKLPFASIVVFKYLGKRIDLNAKRSQCGFFNLNSNTIERGVKNVFNYQQVSHIYPEIFERSLM